MGKSRRTRARTVALRAATALVFALAGFLFQVSSSTAAGTDLRNDGALLRMSDLVRHEDERNEELESRIAEVSAQVDELSARQGGEAGREEELDRLERLAGARELAGAALTVTLDDAPVDARPLLPGVPDPRPNDLVVHQQDIQAVVNALWAGGAEGVQVMDQRLISTSAVRCVGNTLILQGRVYSPPYVITAVGDPARLRDALETTPAIRTYREYVDAYGLGWQVSEGEATLPAYSGPMELTATERVDGRERDATDAPLGTD
ncbi:DUF881 domain-containing protein [Allostreptomyces psammosilenae]|uniref:Uncharacterized protein YlxW (UPF0749 family) n=1 Tax=Allostreptomyces psammosilenae TaxID=1892865 RepID=A0A852ZSK5_9ACTN|nr:DUF881 domain-containing protein [Allostreptomyces psammosilenae]NYI05383.1 uncharacterized protein YlxW (UPF0749 family) [Allostreptomyces psammosilenae]